DDSDRLLELLGRDEPVGEMAGARGLEPKLELVLGAHGTARQARGELLGAGPADPLLGGEQRAGERREVGVRRTPVCPDEGCGAPVPAAGGAAVRPNTSRAVWPAPRGPKRSSASSVVAVRSAWPWASASAAPDSARVVRIVTSNPSRAK